MLTVSRVEECRGFTQVCHGSSFHGRVLTVLLWVHCKNRAMREQQLCSLASLPSSALQQLTAAPGPLCPTALHSQLPSEQHSPAPPHSKAAGHTHTETPRITAARDAEGILFPRIITAHIKTSLKRTKALDTSTFSTHLTSVFWGLGREIFYSRKLHFPRHEPVK